MAKVVLALYCGEAENMDIEFTKSWIMSAMEEAVNTMRRRDEREPFPITEEPVVSVDHRGRKWNVKRIRKYGMYGGPTWDAFFDEALGQESVERCVDFLVDNDIPTGVKWINSSNLPRKESENLARNQVKSHIMKPLLFNYLYEFGVTFSEFHCNELFKELNDYFNNSVKQTRILVLRNFYLEGTDDVEILGYKLRQLNAAEVATLVMFKNYSPALQGSRLSDIPDGKTFDLDPAFCVEIPQAEFARLDYSTDADYIKLKVTTLLRLFKERNLTAETEISTNVGFTSHSNPPAASGRFRTTEMAINQGERYVIDKGELSELSRLANKYGVLYGDKFDSFRIAAKRYGLILERYSPEDWLIDYLIALEALLLPGIKEELKYKLSLRTAFFIGADAEERKSIFNNIEFAYDLRSDIVHGNDIDRKNNNAKLGRLGFTSIYDLTDLIRKYLRRVMLSFIEEYNGKTTERSSHSTIHSEIIGDLEAKILKSGAS